MGCRWVGERDRPRTSRCGAAVEGGGGDGGKDGDGAPEVHHQDTAARCPPGRCSTAAPGRCLSHTRDSTAPLDEGGRGGDA